MTSPRIRLSTFNTHWGGTISGLASISEFVRTAVNASNRCGFPDPTFEGAIFSVATQSDVVCFQEFPLIYDKATNSFRPRISDSYLFNNFDLFCERTLNTSTYEQSNVPLPLRATNRNIGLVIAVRKEFKAQQVDAIHPPRQKGDRSPYRAFPVVKITEPVSRRNAIVANIYGQSPGLKARFNGALANLKSTLTKIDSSDYASDIPVILAGDFNLPLKLVKEQLESFGHGPQTSVADVGATFPKMVIPKRSLKALVARDKKYRVGLQFDHIVSYGGANIDFSRVLTNVASNSDHLAVIAGIGIDARLLAPDFSRNEGTPSPRRIFRSTR